MSPRIEQQVNKDRVREERRISSRNALLPLAVACSLATPLAAELRALDDESMSAVTGMAGLTIDIETEVTIGEVEYVDEGSIYWKDYSLTGIGGGLVDNIRATLDVSSSGERLHTGFSDIAQYAEMGYYDVNETDVAWAIQEYGDGNGNFGKEYNDGDMVIHVTPTDFGFDYTDPNNAAVHASNLDAYKNAIDLHVQQGDFGLRSSDGSIETSLTRNFSVEAYLGYLDIILRNNGNGFHDTNVGYTDASGKPKNIRLADSAIEIDVKFRVEDLDVDSTNNALNTIVPRSVTTPYLTLRNMRIHNYRGNDTLGSFGFASVQYKIAAAKGILKSVDDMTGAIPTDNYVDGQSMYAVNVKWDWDLPNISFGDTGRSIGSVYFTDMHVSNTSFTFSAH